MQRGCVSALTGNALEAVRTHYGSGVEFRCGRRKQRCGCHCFCPIWRKPTRRWVSSTRLRTKIDEAMTTMKTTKENWYEAEINRVAGEIALQGMEPDATKAEACFATALEIARKQKAKSWELRAATSMARLLCASRQARSCARHSCSSLWLVHRGFRHARLAGGRALARGIGARSANQRDFELMN